MHTSDRQQQQRPKCYLKSLNDYIAQVSSSSSSSSSINTKVVDYLHKYFVTTREPMPLDEATSFREFVILLLKVLQCDMRYVGVILHPMYNIQWGNMPGAPGMAGAAIAATGTEYNQPLFSVAIRVMVL